MNDEQAIFGNNKNMKIITIDLKTAREYLNYQGPIHLTRGKVIR